MLLHKQEDIPNIINYFFKPTYVMGSHFQQPIYNW